MRFRTVLAIGAGLCLAAAAYIAPALADVAAATPVNDGTQIYGTIAPYLHDGLEYALTGIAGWLAMHLKWKLASDVVTNHKDMVHSAADTVASLIVAQAGSLVDAMDLNISSPLIREGVQKIEQRVPDAIKALKLAGSTKLDQTLLAKVQQQAVAGGALSPGSAQPSAGSSTIQAGGALAADRMIGSR